MTVTVQIPAQEAPPVKPEAEGSSSAPANTGAPAERPSWLPEKFTSPEDFAKSYAELESKLGSQSSQAPSETQVEQQFQAKGLDLTEFHSEYKTAGKLSDASYQKLEQAGITRQFMDDFIKGQEAVAAQEVAQVFSTIGGEQEYAKINAWAKVNLSKDEVAAFNDLVETAPIQTVQLAMLGLKARYEAANGSEPNLVSGVPGSNVEGFASRYEMVEAMRDPRYKRDEAYRAGVTRRLAASDFF